MDWRLKCAGLHLMGLPPFGRHLHYVAQRYVTRSIPRNIDTSLPWALTHLQAFRAHYGELTVANYFEFGAGWDLFMNLFLYVCGIQHQLAVDLRPYARRHLINHVIRQLSGAEIPGRVDVALTELDNNWIDSLKRLYGITYLTPCDARSLHIPDGTTDLISSTNTLEHIPERDLGMILRECSRICHRDSVVSMIIDYGDHYSYSDHTITPYNYLRFSEARWRVLNPKIHYQNRLRHSDYRRLFEDAGFRVVEETCSAPSDGATVLTNLPLHERFRSYDRTDLAKLVGHFVLRKAD
jgi:hypothetical protein